MGFGGCGFHFSRRFYVVFAFDGDTQLPKVRVVSPRGICRRDHGDIMMELVDEDGTKYPQHKQEKKQLSWPPQNRGKRKKVYKSCSILFIPCRRYPERNARGEWAASARRPQLLEGSGGYGKDGYSDGGVGAT